MDVGAVQMKKPVKSKVYEDLGVEQNLNERLSLKPKCTYNL
jgi:hypothetical protein